MKVFFLIVLFGITLGCTQYTLDQSAQFKLEKINGSYLVLSDSKRNEMINIVFMWYEPLTKTYRITSLLNKNVIIKETEENTPFVLLEFSESIEPAEVFSQYWVTKAEIHCGENALKDISLGCIER